MAPGERTSLREEGSKRGQNRRNRTVLLSQDSPREQAQKRRKRGRVAIKKKKRERK